MAALLPAWAAAEEEADRPAPPAVIYPDPEGYPPPRLYPGEEKFLANLRQLTFGGQNAEAYFSPDGRELILQVTSDKYPCDQIYRMDLETGVMRLVSTGRGVTTCSFILSDGKKFIYSSTHLYMDTCPPRPDYSQGYVWALHPEYEIFMDDGQGKLTRLTYNWGYDAEATVDWKRNRMVFTSYRNGDLDIYLMDLNTYEVRRLTDELGYDGGPFFSYDGEWIVYRSNRPRSEEEKEQYRELLRQGLIRPMNLEIYAMRSDGSDKRQLTDNGAANFAPFMHPSDKYVIFASNMGGNVREFDLYLVPLEGGEPVRVTTAPGFDGFPMFSPDGKKLVFASNRNGLRPGETNIFIADWIWSPETP